MQRPATAGTVRPARMKASSSRVYLLCIMAFVLCFTFLMIAPSYMDSENRQKELSKLDGLSRTLRDLEERHHHIKSLLATWDAAGEGGDVPKPPHVSSGRKQEPTVKPASTLRSHQASREDKEDTLLTEGIKQDTVNAGEVKQDVSASATKENQVVEAVSEASTPAPGVSLRSLGAETAPPSVLVVGGTDGSGTRRVVQILTQLGVTMVSEDPETYDIHADAVKGWPPVVKPVISSAKTLNYDPTTLPSNVRETAVKNLKALIDIATRDSHKPTSYKLAVGGVLPKGKEASADRVQFGFKAPVAMTLCPLWAFVTPHFKFLHVVRDGRDIAFSANQGPVEKFYNDMYGADKLRKEVKAVRLWSDWNSQIQQWATKYSETISTSSSSSGKSFGYLSLHSEDIVSENIGIRFAALTQLSEWVGSNLNDEELCCIAVSDGKFMGSHDRTDPKKAKEGEVSKRYGKWHSQVAKNPTLGKDLHTYGQTGLAMFGYEPLRMLAPENYASKTGFVCSAEIVESCGEKRGYLKGVSSAPPPKTQAVLSYKPEQYAGCSTEVGMDYRGVKGSDIRAVDIKKGPPSECCYQCRNEPKCSHFTLDTTSNLCYLKSSRGIPTKSTATINLISGSVSKR